MDKELKSTKRSEICVRIRDRLRRTYTRVKPILGNRWFRMGVQLGVILLSLAYLVGNFENVGPVLAEADINYLTLFAAWGLTTIAVFLGALGWGFTLRGFDQSIPWKESIRIHLVSNLAKYVPGYAWQLVGKAYMTRRTGTPTLELGLAMTFELAQLVLLGVGLAMLCLPVQILEPFPISSFWREYAALVKFGGVILLSGISFAAFRSIMRRSRYLGRINLRFNQFFFSGTAIFTGWIAFGFAYWLMGLSISPLSLREIPVFVFTLTASIVIGLVIIFIPGSIGVRESLMVFFLTGSSISPALALIIAVLSRIIVTFSELTAYLIYLIYTKISNTIQNASPNNRNSPKEVL